MEQEKIIKEFGVVHQSQRGYFSEALYNEMSKNDKIYLILVDLGYRVFDSIRRDFPERVILTGASEQAAVGIAVGLAQEGCIPFVYTITSFLLRAAETISLYIDQEQANVKLVGGGRDDDYYEDGKSHWGYGAQLFLEDKSIDTYHPEEKEEVANIIKEVAGSKSPCFISLKR